MLLAFIGTFALTNAVVVEMFADEGCGQSVGTRNVYDNTCAPTQGFQSFRVISNGGGNQFVRSYSPNNCAGPQTQCIPASGVYNCIRAINGAGGSNAFGSSTIGC
jgi:hypothetical protein